MQRCQNLQKFMCQKLPKRTMALLYGKAKIILKYTKMFSCEFERDRCATETIEIKMILIYKKLAQKQTHQ